MAHQNFTALGKGGAIALALLSFFVVRGAAAAGQLSLADLVNEADAVAVVDNPLRSSVAVRRWLKGTEPKGSFTLLSPLCIPDRDMLIRWKKKNPTHPGAPVWDRALSVGHMDQLVFFKRGKKGVATPFCETEVMLGTGFGAHADFGDTVAEVERLLDVKLGRVPETTAPPAPPPEPAPAAPPPPPTSSGCW